MNMPKITIWIALALMTLGVVAYLLSAPSGATEIAEVGVTASESQEAESTTPAKKSVTALIPAFVGIVLLLLGIIGQVADGARKHVMHLGMVIALLGAVAALGRFFSSMGSASTLGATSLILMAVLCALYLFMGIRSFRAARLAREAAAKA